MSARTVASGNQVLPTAARLMPLMNSVSGSAGAGVAYSIAPGTVDPQQGLVVLGEASSEVFYIHDGTLKALATPEFLRGYLLGQVASEVYRRTAWIIPASRLSMAFGMGMAIGFAGAVAVAANLVVLLGRYLVFVDAHPNEVALVRQHLPPVVNSLLWFRRNCPVLYGKLSAVLQRGVVQVLQSAPSGITAEDAAAVLGRLLGGVAAAPETGFAVLAGIVARTLTVYTALHLPLLAGRGVAQHPTELSRALADELRRQQVSISADEQRQIAQELARSAEALTQLRTLNQSLAALAPALNQLLRDFQRAGR